MNLQTMKIGPRLGLGFGIVLALCMVLGWVGYSGLAKQGAHLEAIGGNILPSIKQLGDLQTTLSAYRRWSLRAVYSNTDEARSSSVAQMNEARELLRTRSATYRKDMLLTGTPEEPLYATYESMMEKYFQLDQQRMLPALANGARGRGEAEAVLVADSLASFNAALKALDELTAYNVKIANETVASAHATHARSVTLLATSAIAALVLGMLAAFLITRSITSPLRQAVGAANAIAAGDLSVRIEPKGRDEAAELMSSMKSMSGVISSLIAAQTEMSRQHTAGAIDHKIPTDQFPGAFHEAAELINEVVAAHIAVKFRVVEVIGAYAKGDLTVRMDRLPGKKGDVTAAVDAVQASLANIIGQIKEATDSINTAAKEI
ncbi:MAG: MCP four helix bundle domain-containing protein, partial [Burkholderiales bacterium]|nr:MCP four helix bundle domain-containing protein [Burkholderiales bacterium]